MKKAFIKKAILLISLLLSVSVLSSCSLLGIRIDSKHFPAAQLWTWVRTCDSDGNGYLSKKEVEDANSLIIWEQCDDLSGIEYLTNLETLSLQHGYTYGKSAIGIYKIMRISANHCLFFL